MTKESAPLFLPLVQALADGKDIEKMDGDGTWKEYSAYCFDGDPQDYRIVEPPAPVKTLGEVAFHAMRVAVQSPPTIYVGSGSEEFWEPVAEAVIAAYLATKGDRGDNADIGPGDVG